MKAVVAAFNQEKALVGAFSVIVQPVVETMDVRELPHLNMTAAESGGPSWPVPPNIVSPSCSAANILRLRGDGEMTRVQSRCI